jgi:basic membrane protein A
VTFPEYEDIILPSIEKSLNVSVMSAIEAIVENTFIGGSHIEILGSGEVGIAPFHNLASLIPAKVKSDLEQLQKDVIAGKIKTKP